jgi:hypothetical protein
MRALLRINNDKCVTRPAWTGCKTAEKEYKNFFHSQKSHINKISFLAKNHFTSGKLCKQFNKTLKFSKRGPKKPIYF